MGKFSIAIEAGAGLTKQPVFVIVLDLNPPIRPRSL